MHAVSPDNSTIELFKASGSKRRRIIDAIKRQSQLQILERHNLSTRTLFAIRIHGEAAKVPSTSNTKQVWFPKQGIAALLRQALQQKNLAPVSEALRKLEAFRVIAGKNPVHQDKLEAMSELFHAVRGGMEVSMNDSPDNRMFVQIVLPKSVRGDSHNYTKPILDWLETIGVLSNDRNADAFAIRCDRFALPLEDCLLIIVRPFRNVLELESLVRDMVTSCP